MRAVPLLLGLAGCVSGAGKPTGETAEGSESGAVESGEADGSGADTRSTGLADTGAHTLPSGLISLAAADAELDGLAEDDIAGVSLDLAGDIDGDGRRDLLIGAWYEGHRRGTVYVVAGPPPPPLTLDEADAALRGEEGDHAGISVASLPDLDGDGYDEILVGAREHDGVGGNEGAAYLVFGPVVGELALSEAEARLEGVGVSDFAGHDVAATGDTDGDGLAEVLVAAPLSDLGDVDSGAVYLLSGAVSGDVSLSEARASLAGEAAADEAGESTAGAGDTDGDGLADVVVGAWLWGVDATQVGAAYLVAGPVTGALSLADADARLYGDSEGEQAGVSVAGVGDSDGDGYADVLVGAWEPAANGAAFLIRGPLRDRSLAAADGILQGENLGDKAGMGVGAAGDADGDGLADLLIGASGGDALGSFTGQAYLVLGPASGTASLSASQALFGGPENASGAGLAVAGGDADGDGYSDLLIGAPYADTTELNAGGAWLFYGGQR